MSAKNFKFVSPGVFIKEIDNSQLPKTAPAVGPVVIGRFRRGPAFLPTRVESLSELFQIFGEPIRGDEASDVWRGGLPTGPTYGAYAAAAWLKNGAPITIVRILGDQHEEATSVTRESRLDHGGNPIKCRVCRWSLRSFDEFFFFAEANRIYRWSIGCNLVFPRRRNYSFWFNCWRSHYANFSGSGVLVGIRRRSSQQQNLQQLFDERWMEQVLQQMLLHLILIKIQSIILEKFLIQTRQEQMLDHLFQTASEIQKKYFLGETYEQAVKSTLSGTKVYGVILPLGDSAGAKSRTKV